MSRAAWRSLLVALAVCAAAEAAVVTLILVVAR